MDHNAGGAAVRQWVLYWSTVGRASDIEFMIETVRFVETRIFLRRVLADEYIVDAAGTLRADSNAASGGTSSINGPTNSVVSPQIGTIRSRQEKAESIKILLDSFEIKRQELGDL